MFADYKSSSSEAEDNKGITTIQKVEIRAEIPVESNKIPQIDDDGSDVLAQFYDEIEQVEFSFKSQSDQQTFESVQENFVEEKTVVENTTLKEASSLLNPVTAVPDSLAVAVEKIDEVDNVEPQTTTQKIFKILHSKKLISKKMFDYTAPCLSELQSKIEKWTELKNEGLTFNNRLENTHAFRNPSIMSKMISFLELDPYASNMRKEIYDPDHLRTYPDSKKLVERKPIKVNNTNRLSFGASQRDEKSSKKSKKRPNNSEQKYSIGPKRRI